MSTPHFGEELIDAMSVAHFDHDDWSMPELGGLRDLSLHPASHALHYGSSCFEGLKAHRGVDGVVRLFRLDRHIERLQASARALLLAVPTRAMIAAMVTDVVRCGLDAVPDAPGALYIRIMLMGTEPNIGAAGHPSTQAMAFVIAGPVGAYFRADARPLVVAVETELNRTAPHFGGVKAGANYAMALAATMRAREQFAADQVLFAPGGMVTETGASNVLLLDADRVVTPAVTPAFLDGVTHDSILVLADELGLHGEQLAVEVDELLAWARRPDGEIVLSGTTAVVTAVGEIIHDGATHTVGTGRTGPAALRLRRVLSDVHTARRPDPAGWLTPV